MGSLQQVLDRLFATNKSVDTPGNMNVSSSSSTPPLSSPMPFSASVPGLIGLLISQSALRDWLKLIVLGTLLETCRRLYLALWDSIVNSFFLTAHFDEDDPCYSWTMLWLSKQTEWKNARNVYISTSNFGVDSHTTYVNEKDDCDTRKIKYLPADDESYNTWYKGHFMQITRGERAGGVYGQAVKTLKIRIFSFHNDLLTEILEDAKRQYSEAQSESISIYVSDSRNGWRLSATRPKRSLQSVVLDPGVKELLVEDAKDFLQSKAWYVDRGIPFRRGYLLYGAPGSGKTSIIHSLASELGLDVYIVSLSRSGLDDNGLSELISDLPEKCICLMEDIDASFHHGLTRENASNEEDPSVPGSSTPAGPSQSASRVSLSGLLNALDGVAAQEGRILYATTNKYSSLDPALCRPGRMDLHVEFKLASKYQMGELYKRFYLPASPDKTQLADEETAKADMVEASENEKEDGLNVGFVDVSDGLEQDLIELDAACPSTVTLPSSIPSEKSDLSLNDQIFSGISHRSRGVQLTSRQVSQLANLFTARIPERQFSMAELQGYLMVYKTRPFEAVKDAAEWVQKQRQQAAEKLAEKSRIKRT